MILNSESPLELVEFETIPNQFVETKNSVKTNTKSKSKSSPSSHHHQKTIDVFLKDSCATIKTKRIPCKKTVKKSKEKQQIPTRLKPVHEALRLYEIRLATAFPLKHSHSLPFPKHRFCIQRHLYDPRLEDEMIHSESSKMTLWEWSSRESFVESSQDIILHEFINASNPQSLDIQIKKIQEMYDKRIQEASNALQRRIHAFNEEFRLWMENEQLECMNFIQHVKNQYNSCKETVELNECVNEQQQDNQQDMQQDISPLLSIDSDPDDFLLQDCFMDFLE